jgi:hypothetical protein
MGKRFFEPVRAIGPLFASAKSSSAGALQQWHLHPCSAAGGQSGHWLNSECNSGLYLRRNYERRTSLGEGKRRVRSYR